MGPGPGFPAADPDLVPPDTQHVAVGQGAEADRLGVDADAAAPAESTTQSPVGVRSRLAWNAETLGSVSRNLHPLADPIKDITRFIGQTVDCDGPLRNSRATSGKGSRL